MPKSEAIIGRHIKCFVKPNDMDGPEERRLISIVQHKQGSEKDQLLAETKLVETHIAYVASIVARYAQYTTIEIGDLMSSGLVGMRRSIHRFRLGSDPAIRLICCSGWWIRAEIIKAMHENRSVRLPHAVMVGHSKMSKRISESRQMNGDDVYHVMDDLSIPEIHRETLKNGTLNEVSLDGRASGSGEDDEEISIVDTISSTGAEEIEHEVFVSEVAGKMKEVLDMVDVRLWPIIMHTHELCGAEYKNSSEIGEMFGMSREWVRKKKIYAETLLRKSSEIRRCLG